MLVCRNKKKKIERNKKIINMNTRKFTIAMYKIKECPKCHADWKGDKLSILVNNNIATITCKCGWTKNIKIM